MEITMSLEELFYVILGIIGIVLGIYLILLIKNAYEVVKTVKKSVTEDSLDKIVKDIEVTAENAREITDLVNEESKEIVPIIPEIVNDVKEISSSSKKTISGVEKTISALGDGISKTSEAVSSGAEDIISYVKIIAEVVKSIMGMFSKK